jgi:hypothetical protein
VNYAFHDEHKKIDLDRLKLLTIDIYNGFNSDEENDEINKIIDNLYPKITNDDTPLNFSEYSSFIGNKTGYDLLGRPYVIKKIKKVKSIEKVKKVDKTEKVEPKKTIKPKVIKARKIKSEGPMGYKHPKSEEPMGYKHHK